MGRAEGITEVFKYWFRASSIKLYQAELCIDGAETGRAEELPAHPAVSVSKMVAEGELQLWDRP